MDIPVLPHHSLPPHSRHRAHRASVGVYSFQSTDSVQDPLSSSLPPKWNNTHTRNRSASCHLSLTNNTLHVSSSTDSLQREAEGTPLTDHILKVGREMEDPKAHDLKFLLEDAKVLHKKLMALDMEGVNLEKVGLFSTETLASFQTPSMQKPHLLISDKLLLRQKILLKLRQSAVSEDQCTATPAYSSTTLPRQGKSLPQRILRRQRSSSIKLIPSSQTDSTCVSDTSKSKILKRNILSAFATLRSPKRVHGDLSRPLSNEPRPLRHSIASFFTQKTFDQSLDQRTSAPPMLGAPVADIIITPTSQTPANNSRNRCRSLDILDFNSPSDDSELFTKQPSLSLAPPTYHTPCMAQRLQNSDLYRNGMSSMSDANSRQRSEGSVSSVFTGSQLSLSGSKSMPSSPIISSQTARWRKSMPSSPIPSLRTAQWRIGSNGRRFERERNVVRIQSCNFDENSNAPSPRQKKWWKRISQINLKSPTTIRRKSGSPNSYQLLTGSI